MRPVVIFFFFFFCLGWPYIRLLNLESRTTELTLSVALSQSMSIILTQIFLFSDIWSVDSVVAAAAGVAVFGVVLQLVGKSF